VDSKRWVACFELKGKTAKKNEIPHNIFLDLVLYGKDELLGSQPLCSLGSPEKHMLTSHRRDQSLPASQPAIKLDATLGCHTEISKSFGSGDTFPAAASGMRLKFSGENPFLLHLPVALELELAENSNLCHVCHQSTMDTCILGLSMDNFKQQVSNHHWQTNFTLFETSRYLESSSLHSGRLSMKDAGRFVAAVEEQLL